MGKLNIEDDEGPSRKRCRTDSGYGDLSQASQDSSASLERKSGGFTPGATASSPILLSDEPDVIVTEEARSVIREPTIIIYLGSVRQQVAQSKYLPHVWRSGLDSTCAVCHQEFTEKGEPPIRTFTFEDSEELGEDTSDVTQIPIAPHPIRVFNRHFKCLKLRRIKYIPISHVWHGAVSQAQVAREPTSNAIRLGYQVPIRSLLALTRHFGRLEVWHDYISVPQWQTTTQQQLLLQLPNIFSYPERMIMHLHDVPQFDLNHRMWVVLEYVQSQKAGILSQYYDVFDTPAADLCDLAGENLGKYIGRLGQNRFNELAQAKGFHWSKRACWDDQQTWKHQDPGLRTLGAAMFIIGQKTCRDYRDYFFGMRLLLGLRQNEAKINTILSDNTFESYLALCWDALEGGDYSPLLFLPPGTEEPDPRAPWLRGHSRISHDLWDYGACRQRASSPAIIREGRIRPELECVGAVRSFEPYDFFGSAEAVFYRVAKKIIDVGGTCPEAFRGAVSRVFPPAAAKGVFSTPPAGRAGASGPEAQPADLGAVRKHLERLGHLAFRGEHRAAETLQASRRLLSVLGLGLPERRSSLSRIGAASEEARWYGRRLEGLAVVRCRGCARDFLFRATVWDPPPPPPPTTTTSAAATEMYRIPGLLYDDTVAGGVGLVVREGRIVGKMAYATPACGCRVRELVGIESGACR
ncbi:hypothetical protein SAMD00023353_2701090 [Rosellinia necatrix]|uniref:Heterokaryon incompatibility domain-containing protein n=1 Tax=Rosellinia necatrix TaxID=77044 RepID=A0A1W2TGS2_ROSNE|nr:hypothetical protein SAMD00023353_2701090 [Rosellinia necatrix]